MNHELKLIVLQSAENLGNKVEAHLKKLKVSDEPLIINISEPVFSSGERKTVLKDSVRGKDIYILGDIGNYGITYNIRGHINRTSPYDNYKAIKDTIGAIAGDTNRINVVMPLMIDSRQHRREAREPLTCAIDLQELIGMGVNRIITVDIHDPSVRNAIPLNSFNNLPSSISLLESFIKNEQSELDFNNLIIISPDQGAGPRTLKIANQLGRPMGTFSKRRDLSGVVDGKNPIIAHDYLGQKLEGKDILVVDDMISSGDSMLDIAKMTKDEGVEKVYFMVTFPLFTHGIDAFDLAKENKLFEKLYTTNYTYIDPEYLSRPWLKEVDCSEYLSKIIYQIHLNQPISELLSEKQKILEGPKLILKR